jgi:outer membrane immunogenic protein
LAGPGQALAADLGGAPPRRYAEPMVDYAPAPIWTGLYVGGTVGYAWGADTSDSDGFAGTLFAGYNWQHGATVFGVEADIGMADFGGTTWTGIGPVSIDTNSMGSFRARAGFLMTPALLLYVTGGAAWADLDVGLGGMGLGSGTHWGYQIGGGAEMKFSQTVSLRLEYIYTDLESAVVATPVGTAEVEPDYHTIRAGVAFKF